MNCLVRITERLKLRKTVIIQVNVGHSSSVFFPSKTIRK